MTAPRSASKPSPAPSSKRPARERTGAEREGERSRKRAALERFVDKNAKVLAELAK